MNQDQLVEEVVRAVIRRLAESGVPGEGLRGLGIGPAASTNPATRHEIPVAVSNRHVHLCQADCDVLFGPGHKLEPFRELSQSGESSRPGIA